MSARGAADFLTRATAVLASLFVMMSILLAFLAANRNATSVDTSLQRRAPAPAAGAPPVAQPQQPGAVLPGAPAPAPADNSGVPLAR